MTHDYGKLLYELYYTLHPTYSNTAGRTGGIGGQAMTTHCSVIHPNREELELLEEVQSALSEWYRSQEQ